MQNISVRGARTHNLKSIDVTLPRDKLIVITGLSGSGKSSLAFDTLYAEGQRRYVESLSAYARQFLSVMGKPDVDHIEGLSPAISIEQKTTSHNPRSTVGTVTELYDYLRLLFARIGKAKCPTHGTILEAKTVHQMVSEILSLPTGTKVILMAPIVKARKGEHLQLLKNLAAQGFIRVRLNGEYMEITEVPKLALHKKHTIDLVIDRLVIKDNIKTRLIDSFETALRLGQDLACVEIQKPNSNKQESLFSATHACTECGYTLAELEPRLFSFNNPAGACPECDGLGHHLTCDKERIIPNPALSLAQGALLGWDKKNRYYYNILSTLSKHYKFDIDKPFNKLPKKIQDIILYGNDGEKLVFKFKNDAGDVRTYQHAFEGVIPNYERRYKETQSQGVREDLTQYFKLQPCPHCEGTRLKIEARNVFVHDKSLPEIAQYPIAQTLHFFKSLKLTGQSAVIAEKIIIEITQRLGFLIDVGLDYLSLDRTADTLSGGEAQRIRLASQIGAGLVGVMYILDEPSIGLHQRDNDRLLATLKHLRDLGNTVIVVEHDTDAILAADYVLDLGPGAGIHGGHIVAQGTPAAIKKSKQSLTGQYLAGIKKIEVPVKRKQPDTNKLIVLEGATGNNLKNISVQFPIGLFTCVTGVSGSGKSTLVNDTLSPVAAHLLNHAQLGTHQPYKKISGLEHLDKVVVIDQSPIGRTPRSNAATYTGVFSHIRELFAGTPEARSRGYTVGRFSFNVKGGRCEACEGDGLLKVTMHFLADVYVLCDVCQGQRYNPQTLEIYYKGKNIHEILNLTVEDAHTFFQAIPPIARKLKTLMDVGLSYITLGQSATTLSGGEAQRVKLAKELSRRDTGDTLYILDEPTTGLHFHDVQQLLNVLTYLKEKGNTIIVIEHNLDVIKTADWIIDLGPQGGDKGGELVAMGSPEKITKIKRSYTGHYLIPVLNASS